MLGIYEILSKDNGKIALDLVGGFGIPEHMIMAPIASDWRNVTYHYWKKNVINLCK